MKRLGQLLLEKIVLIIGYTLGGAGIAVLLFFTFFEWDPGSNSPPGLAGFWDRVTPLLHVIIVLAVVGGIVGLISGIVVAISGG